MAFRDAGTSYCEHTCMLLVLTADALGSGAVEIGSERGYVVEMRDDTLEEPYVLAPGQNVRLVSRYDASMDHFGMPYRKTPWGCPLGLPPIALLVR